MSFEKKKISSSTKAIILTHNAKAMSCTCMVYFD